MYIYINIYSYVRNHTFVEILQINKGSLRRLNEKGLVIRRPKTIGKTLFKKIKSCHAESIEYQVSLSFYVPTADFWIISKGSAY